MIINRNYNLIVASNKENIIGHNNTIPWYIPEDLQRFKQLTTNNIVIMGRKTFESLPNGALPNRINIVLTSSPDKYQNTNEKININGELLFTNFEKVFDIINQYTTKDVYIIGGSEIYKLFIDYCTTIYLTIVHYPINIHDNTDNTDNINTTITYLPVTYKYLKENYIETACTNILKSKTGVDYQYITLTK